MSETPGRYNLPERTTEQRLTEPPTEKLKTLEQAIALIEQDNLDWCVCYREKDQFPYRGTVRSGLCRATSGEHDSPLGALLDAYARYKIKVTQYPVTRNFLHRSCHNYD